MRLIALLALASFFALVAFPQSGMAWERVHTHDCAACPTKTTGHDMQPGGMGPVCAKMGMCAIAVIPEPFAPPVSRMTAGARYTWVPSGPANAIDPLLDLPPPRSWSA